MAIRALALLRVPADALPSDFVVKPLEDGALVRTDQRFDAEPEALLQALVERVGDVMDDHDEPRGILMVPDVAEVSSATYDEVVDEIGEGGTWVAIDEGLPEGTAMLANLMSMLSSPDILGRPDVQHAMERARKALEGDGELEPELGAMMQDPAIQQIIQQLGAQIAADPEKLAALQQLLEGDDGEDEDDEPPRS